MDLVWLIKVDYTEDYKLKLIFNDMTEGTVCLKNYLKFPIYEPLKEIEYFKKYKLNSWTLEWPNGADFAPEFLYQIATQYQLESANK